MKKLKKLVLFLLTAAMLCIMSITAFAVTELPDLNQRGSLTITVKKDDQILPGGTLKVYQIASVAVEGESYSYVYTDGFAGCGVPLSNTQAENLTPEKAVVWSTYAEQHNISYRELSVGQDGIASDAGLELGLYLVQQGTAAEGYTMSEIVVPLPLEEEDGTLNYVVEAIPKVTEPLPSEPSNPGNPGTGSGTEPGNGSGSGSGNGSGTGSGGGGGSNSGGSTGGSGSKLPQTGQLWWPVFLLTVGGILLYSLGWKSNRKINR